MKIKQLVIENFKSIERIELIEPSPFTVFVGPNGSGKSNIFEALEFFNLAVKTDRGTVESLFGGKKHFINRQQTSGQVKVDFDLDGSHKVSLFQRLNEKNLPEYTLSGGFWGEYSTTAEFSQLVANFSRLFVGKDKQQKLNFRGDLQLTFSADNLEKVLKRVLTQQVLKNEIFEWLELFVPEFKGVEIDDRDELHWFEHFSEDYFTKDLISDGTYNILAMLTAVYQSDDKPQFLCIEEPENGLHPQVAGELIDFFRIMCEERGHHIWLNTHSQSMIARLKPEEMVVVEKKQGKTQTTQYKDRDFHGLRMDEALLMNVLGGGLPW